jgi:hypothetical protein
MACPTDLKSINAFRTYMTPLAKGTKKNRSAQTLVSARKIVQQLKLTHGVLPTAGQFYTAYQTHQSQKKKETY